MTEEFAKLLRLRFNDKNRAMFGRLIDVLADGAGVLSRRP